MKIKKPLTNKDGEVRELTTGDFKYFRPASEALPLKLQEKLTISKRGPQRSPIKERITIRLSREVVEKFRATGDGWQTRVDAALRDWLKNHSPA
jgi:uncharacterized protein (DUF4415 family)